MHGCTLAWLYLLDFVPHTICALEKQVGRGGSTPMIQMTFEGIGLLVWRLHVLWGTAIETEGQGTGHAVEQTTAGRRACSTALDARMPRASPNPFGYFR